MTLPINDDLVNCELSIEELEAIAAGGFWSSLGHIVGDVAKGGGYVLEGLAYAGGLTAIALGVYALGSSALSGQRGVTTVNGHML